MSLRIQLTVTVRPDRNDAFQKSVRSLAEKASTLDSPMYWTAYETRFGALGTWHFMSERDYWVDLGRRGNARTYIRESLGERKGKSVLEDLTRSIVRVEERVKQLRPELCHLPDQLDGRLPMALLHLGQVRLGHAAVFEDMLRALAEAIPKVDDRERLVTHEQQIGPVGLYSVARWGNDESDLDGQLTLVEILQRVHGVVDGAAIWSRGLECLERAERWILVHRPELSHPQPGELGMGRVLVSP